MTILTINVVTPPLTLMPKLYPGTPCLAGSACGRSCSGRAAQPWRSQAKPGNEKSRTVFLTHLIIVRDFLAERTETYPRMLISVAYRHNSDYMQ
jgi:hypothetical protein